MERNQHPGPLELDPQIMADGWLEIHEANEGESVFLSILPSTALLLAERLREVASEYLQ